MAILLSKSAEKAPKPTKSTSVKQHSFGLGSKVSGVDRLFFTEQLALLIETGMPLMQSLGLLAEQTENGAMRSVVRNLEDGVANGKSLSAAMADHPKVFSTTYVNLVAASEGGGFLHEVLKQLLHMEERRESLRNTVVSALTYPAFLIVFSVLTIVFVLVFVFPKFGDMFAAIADELPQSTVWLLAASDLLTAHWQWLLAGVVLWGFVITRWLKSAEGQIRVDALKLSVPGVRNLSIQLYLAQSLRVLGLSIKHGIPIVEALEACRDSVSNRRFQTLLHKVETTVRDGGRISDEFEASEFVPTLAKQMLRTAEEAGNLSVVGERLSDYYEREMAKKLDRFAKLVEPMMLLVMGGLVGVIVSSLVLPIFKLSSAVT